MEGPTNRNTRTQQATSPLWAKIMVFFGAMLMFVTGGTLAYAFILFDKVNNIQQENILGLNDSDGIVEGPLNLLMLGSDMRVNPSDNLVRADTIMILHIDKDLTEATILSIPRDLLVDIPDCGKYAQGPCRDKINSAYAYGGTDPAQAASNLAQTITDVSGIQFSGVAIVNFEGFLDVVRTFGGIELCLPHDIVVRHPKGKEFHEGCRRYNPDDALSIVRERYAWDDADFGRQRMQQHFIRQLLKEAQTQGYVSDPTKVGTLIDQIGAQLILDLNKIPPVDYAISLRNVDIANMQTLRLPSTSEEIDDVWYVVIHEGEERIAADSLFEAFRNDTISAWVRAHPDYVNKDMNN